MKGFKYIKLDDMSHVIRNNLSKIPHDIDFVIGVPRSGMLCASIIAEFINVPLIDVDSFINGNIATGGGRLGLFKQKEYKRVLVVDDTVNSGLAMSKTKAKLAKSPRYSEYEFIYMCIFIDGPGSVDLYLEDLREYPKKDIQPLYEWNIFNHYPHIMCRFMWDIDGVFCTEEGRPDDSDEEGYENYIKTVKPLFIPKVPISTIVTYRIKKYSSVTEEWLKEQGIRYNNIIMFDADRWQDRNYSGISSSMFKGMIYKNSKEFLLFIESDDRQAREIHQISGKPVLSVEKNILYE